jgi:SAM-dependent methyltransferase
MNIPISHTSHKDINRYIADHFKSDLSLEDVWNLIDEVWDDLGCDNESLDCQKLTTFYSHPIWILNGLFIEQHEISLLHRKAITRWVINNFDRINSILDYGGGFGTLARMIAGQDNKIEVHIYEPHPSDEALVLSQTYPNLHFIDAIRKQYDCLVSTDVLEHCPDPLTILNKMADGVKVNGVLIIANNFYPVIKCHMPLTFHLRYTFNHFGRAMGLRCIGPCQGSHAQIYQKVTTRKINWAKLRKFEAISKVFFPFLEKAHMVGRRMKQTLR